jgi:sensor histidine kinase regulating citrate/malate metabolism
MSGMQQLMKSMFNIDPAELSQAVNGFQAVMGEIKDCLVAIRTEQNAQRVILDRLSAAREMEGTHGTSDNDVDAARDGGGPAVNGVDIRADD